MLDRPAKNATIRFATSADAEAIASIYNYYVDGTVVTFEEESVSRSEMARRIDAVSAASLPWLVAELPDLILGYAYGSPWKQRSAYRFSAEVTVYIAHDQLGLGLGSRLYGELFPLTAYRCDRMTLQCCSVASATERSSEVEGHMLDVSLVWRNRS